MSPDYRFVGNPDTHHERKKEASTGREDFEKHYFIHQLLRVIVIIKASVKKSFSQHLGVILHDLGHDPGFSQGGNVPELVGLVSGHLPQNASHDLARSGFWQP